MQWIVADRPAVALVISNVRDEGTYTYGTKVKPTCTATDADGHPVDCAGAVTGGNADGSGLFTYKALATDAVTGKVSAARVSWTVGSKPAPSVAVSGVVNGNVYAYGTTVAPSCVAADADGKTLTCEGMTSSSKVASGAMAFVFKATVTDPATGLMSSASATWTVAAAGKAAISGLPTKTKSGHPVLVSGKSYTVTVSFAGSTQSDADWAPSWLKPVATNAAGTSGTPRTVIGNFTPAAAGSYVWTFTPSKAMKGSFRKFGVKTSDGKVTYQMVYVK